MEKIIKQQICNQCSIDFSITQNDRDFYTKISPIFGGKKYEIPDPTLCPDCRRQRRLSFRNERYLYKRKCSATGKDIISMYSSDKDIVVYEENFWWGDNWDALDYGIDFDPDKNFFNQLDTLLRTVPQPALINHISTQENSQYTNYSGYLKNCYLVCECANSQDLLYSEGSRHMQSSLDMTICTRSEESYFCCDIFDCHKVFYSSNSSFCSDSYYLKECNNCRFCYNCEKLSHKSYCIDNIQYSEQEYFQRLEKLTKSYDPHMFSYNLDQKTHLFMKGSGNEEVTGDYIFHSKHAYDSYYVKNLENGRYCSHLSSSSKKSQDCYDYDYFGGAQKIYESLFVGGVSSEVYFSYNTWEYAYKNFYCNMCHKGKNLFGCVGLKDKEYCILNKQYTKEEYEKLTAKIIEHMKETQEWGEFPPASMSFFGYNETIAGQHFDITKEDALKLGFNWSTYETPFPKVDKVIPAEKLPEDISDIPDDILNWAIECGNTKKPFRIVKQELEFYRKHRLPIPRLHPEERYKERIQSRNPRKLFTRNCDKCSVEIQTSYAPERPEKVYCETCYNSEKY